jgi:hypothetical protein
MNRSLLLLIVFSIVAIVAATAAAETIFIPDLLGFEDDVDIVVSPNLEFMVVPEESEDGSEGRVKIIDLDPATGEPLGILFEEDLADSLGFENGVDLIIKQMETGEYLIMLPVEKENGSRAMVILLLTDHLGTVTDRIDIDLGDLGFREDVDGLWDSYSGSIAFFPLESEDQSVRGVLAIDVSLSDGDWGSCLLLSTDGREGPCDSCEAAPWLPVLAPGMDPVTYEKGDRLRLALPVTTPAGCDLLFLDFDSDDLPPPPEIPPEFIGPYQSVYDINAFTAKHLDFPGYECDVDIVLLHEGACGLDEELKYILIPVENTGDVADLYLIDEDGVAQWLFSLDNGTSFAEITGYEAGVDLLVMCGLDPMVPPHRVAVPIETDDGTDADLYIVNVENGELLAYAEDPALNPGLTIPGYEIGVDLVRWTTFAFAVPVEYYGTGADPGIVILHPDGVAADSYFGSAFLGYQRSVDPIVAPIEPPALIVPIGTDNASDADVVVFPNPPTLMGGYSFELVNAPLRMSRFYWDVDLGLVDKTVAGELYLCVPEEEPGGGDARLRFELTAGLPGDRVMAIATAGVGALPATLYLADVPTGAIILELDNLLGLETGLDMVTGNGPVTPGDMPVFHWPTGIDRDGDPTLVWEGGIVGIDPDFPRSARNFLDNSYPNPFNPTTTIRYGIAEHSHVSLKIYNVAGQLVRTLVNEIQAPRQEGYTVRWNGLNENGRPVSSGVYFYRLSAGDFMQAKKIVLLR